MESRVYEGGNVRIRVVRNDKAQRFQVKIEYLNTPEVNGAMNLTMRVWPD